jgi:hypothetical protein
MRNPTGSKRVKRAFNIAKEDREPLRRVRRCERRAIKDDTRAQVDEYFEEQIVATEEFEEMLTEVFGDDFDGQSHYFEDGKWVEDYEPDYAYADDLLRP